MPLVGPRPSLPTISPYSSHDSMQSWTTSDLCEKCASFNLDLFESKSFSWWIKSPECPLCRFLNEVHSQWTPLGGNQLKSFNIESKTLESHRYSITYGGKPNCFLLSHYPYEAFLCPIPATETRKFSSAFQFKRFTKNVNDYGILREWVSHCETEHSATFSKNNDEYRQLQDLKVIDCSKEEIINAPKNCKYAALSYVWGDLGTVHEARSKLSDGLPNTLKDTIQVVLKLRLQYL